MKKVLTAFVLGLAVWAMTSVFPAARAEESFDFRKDTDGYCRMVAEMNAALEQAVYAQGMDGAEMTMVLFRTGQGPLDFAGAPCQPACVVYGPQGFSNLLCGAPEEMTAWLLEQEGVVYAEPDAEIAGCGTEDVTFQSWGAQKMQMGAYLRFAEENGSGSATVAVIDSGAYRHSLIDPKIRSCGYDYVDNDDDPTNDLNGHGTRVAGIVADCTRNLPVYIHPIRVLDGNAMGKISNVVSAVLEAAEARVDVINLSLSTFARSETLESAIRSAVDAGITVVVAAGNENCDAVKITPAKMTDAGVVVVGSADIDGGRSYFSNYGESVDVYVYGENIVSCSRTGGYVADTGTSMSAPHVSALGAMLNLVHPGISPEETEARIRSASSGRIPVTSARAMKPEKLGFYLVSVWLQPGSEMILPDRALPLTAQERIEYVSSAPGVAEISGGALTARAEGTAEISARCTGFDDVTFAVIVSDAGLGGMTLPGELAEIGAEAFFGLNAAEVTIPSGTVCIGDDAFSGGKIGTITVPGSVAIIGANDFSGAVIVCPGGSAAHEYAAEAGLQYVLAEEK